MTQMAHNPIKCAMLVMLCVGPREMSTFTRLFTPVQTKRDKIKALFGTIKASADSHFLKYDSDSIYFLNVIKCSSLDERALKLEKKYIIIN